MNSNELYHFGIKGMKWGVRRFQDKNGRLTNAGKKRYSDDSNDTDKTENIKKRGLTDKQKKYIKIGAATVVTALAVYGGYKLYKSGKLDGLINSGKNEAGSLFDKETMVNGLKKMSKSESLSDTIKKGNELHGKIEGKNNCVPSSIAGFMRSKGFDVTAKGTGGEMKNLGGVVEECFKGARVVEGSAVKFGKSRDDAAEMLVKKFGDNASGVCSTTWQKAFGGGGHAFSWKIENGKVSFFDVNARVDDDFISKHYFKAMDTNGSIILARLDNAEIDFENIKKYVKNIGN